MKKDKQKLVNADRKAISKDIKMSLVAKLKELTFNIDGSKKLENEIEKVSAKLAKKLSKKIKADRTGVAESGKKQKAASGPESNAKQNSPSLDIRKAPERKTSSRAEKRSKLEA